MSDVVDTQQITRHAYEAYGESVEWKNFLGDPMPKFDELPERIQNAWQASTAAAIAAYERATMSPDEKAAVDAHTAPPEPPPEVT